MFKLPRPIRAASATIAVAALIAGCGAPAASSSKSSKSATTAVTVSASSPNRSNLFAPINDCDPWYNVGLTKQLREDQIAVQVLGCYEQALDSLHVDGIIDPGNIQDDCTQLSEAYEAGIPYTAGTYTLQSWVKSRMLHRLIRRLLLGDPVGCQVDTYYRPYLGWLMAWHDIQTALRLLDWLQSQS